MPAAAAENGHATPATVFDRLRRGLDDLRLQLNGRGDGDAAMLLSALEADLAELMSKVV